jgi:hypothetical protein
VTSQQKEILAMLSVFGINDVRTKFYRCGGEASGVYVLLSGSAWMFTNLSEHGNTFIVRYLSSNTSDRKFREVALATMIVDRTGVVIWRCDPEEHRIVTEKLDRDETNASKMLVAWFGAAYVGAYPLEDVVPPV